MAQQQDKRIWPPGHTQYINFHLIALKLPLVSATTHKEYYWISSIVLKAGYFQ